MPPISLAYVAAAMERAGVPLSIYDDYTEGGDVKRLFEFIKEENPDIVGLSCVTPTATRTYEMALEIRERFPDIKIMMGNLHPSFFYERTISDNIADFVVLGEGEETVIELVKACENESDLTDVKGIAFKADDKIVVTEQRPFIEDLDSLPFPAWHLFPIERYRIFNFARVKEPGTLVLGSRGCPYACNFCSLKIMGRKRRTRSVANIADEFEYLYDRFGYVQPSFIDPIFPFSEKEALDFSDELIKREIHKKQIWITETRVDLVTERMMEAMARAGLKRIMYGFESGTEEGLDSINKRTTTSIARETVEITKKAGVEIIGFFMIGVPGETKEDIERTIRFSQQLNIDFAKYTVFSPFPGTKIYKEMLDDKVIPETEKWSMFTNYPTKENPAIYIPETLKNSDIIKLQRKAFLSFYLRPGMILKQLLKIRTLDISDIINGLLMLLRKQ